MAELGDPVALLLPRPVPFWPLWAMMAVGLFMTTVPFSHGFGSEGAMVASLAAGMGAFGLALFCRLHPPMAYLAYLNAFLGAGVLALRLLELAPGPLWDGPLLLALSLVIPASQPLPAADTPPGWFHNPSTWVQRAPVVALALLGALACRGHRAAAICALTALAGVLTGDRRRWRTAPWALCYATKAAAAMLAVSCYHLLLAPALASLLMLLLSVDELRATRLFLRSAPQLGQKFWDAFWNGGLLPRDEFAPHPSRRPAWAPPERLQQVLPIRRRHSRRRDGAAKRADPA